MIVEKKENWHEGFLALYGKWRRGGEMQSAVLGKRSAEGRFCIRNSIKESAQGECVLTGTEER